MSPFSAFFTLTMTLVSRFLGLLTLSVTFAVVGLSRVRAQEAPQDARPNIVMIMTDDQSWDQMGLRDRYPFLQTPWMDRLAAEGADFRNAFVVTSLCSPSRAAIMTGTYGHINGVLTNEGSDPNPRLPQLGQLLQQAGYETAFVGKWHQGSTGGRDWPRPGFDTWYAFGGQGSYTDWTINHNGERIKGEGYLTDHLSRFADDWIRQPHDRPFCIFVWQKAPHSPHIPAPRHDNAFDDVETNPPVSYGEDLGDKPDWARALAAYGLKQWRSQLTVQGAPEEIGLRRWKTDYPLQELETLLAVDEGLGIIYQALEESGQLDNTFILYTSDNGTMERAHHHNFYGKYYMWEESIRVPMLARYPPLIPPGTVIDAMVLNIDIPETFLGLAGAEISATMQGRSWLPLFEEADVVWRDAFLYEFLAPSKRPLILGVRGNRYKLITYPEFEGDGEFYDLQEDPFEMNNLYHNPDAALMRTEWESRLRGEMAATGLSESMIEQVRQASNDTED